MIIDAHVHVHPDAKGFGDKYDATVEFLIENLEDSPVEKACVLPIAAEDPFLRNVTNDFVAEICEKYPDQLIGFASVDPKKGEAAAKELEDLVTKYDLKGLKLHPRFQGFSPDDPVIFPVVRKAGELGIPVAIDSYIWKPTPLKWQMPLLIDDLAKAAPETKIIVCHSGGYRFMDALFLAKANDNVYLDTSATLRWLMGTPFEDQFAFMLKSAGAERIIFSSDHPEHPTKDCYEHTKLALDKFGFNEEEQGMIFGANIIRLLGI